MITTVSWWNFKDAFDDIRPDNFSYEGLEALFDYLQMLEDDIGKPIELDVIGLCCDYSEYANLKEFQDDCGDEYQSLEDIENRTTLIKIKNKEGFIVGNF
jgi:hypothetical protein